MRTNFIYLPLFVKQFHSHASKYLITKQIPDTDTQIHYILYHINLLFRSSAFKQQATRVKVHYFIITFIVIVD